MNLNGQCIPLIDASHWSVSNRVSDLFILSGNQRIDQHNQKGSDGRTAEAQQQESGVGEREEKASRRKDEVSADPS